MSGSHDKLPKFFWVQLVAAAIIGVIWLFTPTPGGHEAEVDTTMANALKPIGNVALAKPVTESGPPRSGDAIVDKNCKVCHSIGLANAPKLDAAAKADWEARLAVGGLDAVVASAIKGKGGMPPRGGDPTLTDDEITAAIQQMLTGVGIETAEASEAKPATEQPAAIVEETVVAVKEAAKVEVAEVKEETEVKIEALEKAKEEIVKPAVVVKAAATEVAVTEKAGVNAKPAALVATKLGESTYKSSCFACHDSGVANSPKMGDKAVWAPRIAAGISALHTNAIQGKGAMPGKGGNPALSDQAVQEAVNFMVINSQ